MGDFFNKDNQRVGYRINDEIYDPNNQLVAKIKGNEIQKADGSPMGTIRPDGIYDIHGKRLATIDRENEVYEDGMLIGKSDNKLDAIGGAISILKKHFQK